MTVLHERVSRGDTLPTALHRARSQLDVHAPAEFVAWCGLTAYGAG